MQVTVGEFSIFLQVMLMSIMAKPFADVCRFWSGSRGTVLPPSSMRLNPNSQITEFCVSFSCAERTLLVKD